MFYRSLFVAAVIVLFGVLFLTADFSSPNVFALPGDFEDTLVTDISAPTALRLHAGRTFADYRRRADKCVFFKIMRCLPRPPLILIQDCVITANAACSALRLIRILAANKYIYLFYTFNKRTTLAPRVSRPMPIIRSIVFRVSCLPTINTIDAASRNRFN